MDTPVFLFYYSSPFTLTAAIGAAANNTAWYCLYSRVGITKIIQAVAAYSLSQRTHENDRGARSPSLQHKGGSNLDVVRTRSCICSLRARDPGQHVAQEKPTLNLLPNSSIAPLAQGLNEYAFSSTSRNLFGPRVAGLPHCLSIGPSSLVLWIGRLPQSPTRPRKKNPSAALTTKLDPDKFTLDDTVWDTQQ